MHMITSILDPQTHASSLQYTITITNVLTTSHHNSHPPQAEISALENAGRLPASAYAGATMYTTLSPCDMCTGACILYKIPRVVLGENKTFLGGEAYLQQRGVEVVNVESKECEELMGEFIRKQPGDW
jgi:creatinine deaminase